VTSRVERVLGNPVLYDAVQRAAGIGKLQDRLGPILGRLEPGTLVDVGAGTGAFRSLLPPEVRYVPVDVDGRKLERLRAKYKTADGIVASATALPFGDSSVEYTLCTNVFHHLSDPELHRAVGELARVTRKDLILVDPLRVPRLTSRALWTIDRGSYSRSYQQLVDALAARFDGRRLETFSFLHTYLLFVGSPSHGPSR
jgi:ubiquinone/menaquinone biosynthesis C-methylase UbiE